VNSILKLVSSGDSALLEKAHSFLERFSRRIQELSSDIDPEVAASAVELLALFLEQGRLTETEGENVPPLMWDENAEIRARAVHFVYADTFADTGGVESSPDEDLTQLLNLFDKSVDAQVQLSPTRGLYLTVSSHCCSLMPCLALRYCPQIKQIDNGMREIERVVASFRVLCILLTCDAFPASSF
jgi:hypothetical protein